MKLRLRAMLVSGILGSLPTLSAQTPESAPSPAPSAEVSPPSAPSSDAEKFPLLILEAQQLHNEQRYHEAFQKLNEAEKIQPDSPLISNIRGSLYTALRDFDKAYEFFKKSGEQSPNAFEPKFNLAEIDFVRQNYASSEKQFQNLLDNYPKIRQEVRHLTLFKIVICKLMQNTNADVQDIVKRFTFLDDTPAYYYCHAAIDFAKGKKDEAQNWLLRASQIYTPEQNMPYLDSMIEARWVPSIAVPDKTEPSIPAPKIDLSPN